MFSRGYVLQRFLKFSGTHKKISLFSKLVDAKLQNSKQPEIPVEKKYFIKEAF